MPPFAVKQLFWLAETLFPKGEKKSVSILPRVTSFESFTLRGHEYGLESPQVLNLVEKSPFIAGGSEPFSIFCV